MKKFLVSLTTIAILLSSYITMPICGDIEVNAATIKIENPTPCPAPTPPQPPKPKQIVKLILGDAFAIKKNYNYVSGARPGTPGYATYNFRTGDIAYSIGKDLYVFKNGSSYYVGSVSYFQKIGVIGSSFGTAIIPYYC